MQKEKALIFVSLCLGFTKKAESHPDILNKVETRRRLYEDYKPLEKSLFELLQRFSQDIHLLIPHNLTVKRATIIEPTPKADESLEISNRFLAPIIIVAVTSNFKVIKINQYLKKKFVFFT